MTLRPRLELLASAEVEAIVGEAIAVLGEIGVAVENAAARELLAESGARRRGDRYLPDEAMLHAAMASAPRRFALYDRAGEAAVRFGEERTHFDPGSAAIHRLDGATGERRAATVADLVALARLVDGLPNFAAQSTALVAADVPEPLSDSFRLWVALVHARKPVVTGTFRKQGFAAMHAMLLAVRGGAQALRDRPLAIFDCCPTSPLAWSDLTAQALVDAARAGIPAEIVPVPLAGATAPVTLRDTIVQHLAEGLSGLLIHQLAAPGAPVVLGGAPAAFDMRQGTAVMGAIESFMLQAGFAQVGRTLGLPTHGYLGLSDAKTPDYQAGMESAVGAALGALAGLDLVSGAGLLDYLLTQSFEKLLLDHEACGQALRLLRGIETRGGSARELIGAAVDQGQLLGHPHTRRHYREELSLASPLVDRATYGDWLAAGGKSAWDRARDELARRSALPPATPLDPAVRAELDRALAAAARDAGVDELPAAVRSPG